MEAQKEVYRIGLNENVLEIGFADPAQNDEIVQAAKRQLDEMVESGELDGGELIKLNGPASLPVGVTIAHAVSHLYEAVAVFDPKLGQYVVAVSHGEKYAVGDMIAE
jgi:CRISPR-associated protein Csx3